MATAMARRQPRGLSPIFGRDPFAAFGGDMDEMLARFWDPQTQSFGRLVPSLDVAETDNAVEVRIDLPGVNPDEVNIEVASNVLTIKGEHTEEKEEKGTTYHRMERRQGSFSRSVLLPCGIIENEAAAEFHDGVLTVTLPKSKEARGRKIKIRK